eukprot:1625783-Rhodomonas_salina.2
MGHRVKWPGAGAHAACSGQVHGQGRGLGQGPADSTLEVSCAERGGLGQGSALVRPPDLHPPPRANTLHAAQHTSRVVRREEGRGAELGGEGGIEGVLEGDLGACLRGVELLQRWGSSSGSSRRVRSLHGAERAVEDHQAPLLEQQQPGRRCSRSRMRAGGWCRARCALRRRCASLTASPRAPTASPALTSARPGTAPAPPSQLSASAAHHPPRHRHCQCSASASKGTDKKKA